MHGPKGVILMLTIATLLFISLVTIPLLFILNSRVKQHDRGLDRSMAYYLCETGLSFALLDFSMGRVTLDVEKPYDFMMGGKTYPITYVVSKKLGVYSFTATVSSPNGLGCTYSLTMRGKRGFPIFIRGKP